MGDTRRIYCCTCGEERLCSLTSGAEIYPHRDDLADIPFWSCNTCGSYVGCHHKTKNRTAPLGVIPSPEMRSLRNRVHSLIDPIWRSGRMKRKEVYAWMSDAMGWKFHTAKTRSVEEVKKAIHVAEQLRATL